MVKRWIDVRMHDSKQHTTGKISYFSSGLISIGLHLTVLLCMFLFARKMQPEDKPEPLTVQLLAAAKVNPAQAPPAPPQPAPPQPAPPEPAPPELAPPEPAPPQPAPPQPAPPQPAPPKPAPPKPAPPKPAPPKPEPPQASSSKPRVPSLAERLRTAKVQGSAVPARRPPARAESSSNIRSRLLHNVSKSVSVPRNSPSNGSPSGSVMTLAEREAVNYADQVVNPRLAPIWDEVGPSRGDLDEAQSSTVEIVFTVLANGRITLPRISRRSSSAAMNQAAETLLQRIQGLHLPSLAESGIKSAKLSIRITLNAQAAQG